LNHMNILCISKDLSSGDLCSRFQNEGHAVRLFIDDQNQKKNYEGIIKKVTDWKNELEWVGKDGLIIFDSCGYGKEQDELRASGYSVFGGNAYADMLEHDRQYGQKILSVSGIPTVPSKSFSNTDDAIDFVRVNPAKWVIKQNGHVDKMFNYVGQLSSGEDVIDLLDSYCLSNKEECSSIDLQSKIEGVEIGVARYFNGNDWVGPIEINLEHKDLFAGSIGPKTFEMGTLVWYEEDESIKLFQKILAPLKPYLQKIEFIGDVDVDCMINDSGAYPLEITPRLGWPSTHVHVELHISPWGEFLKAVADGKPYDLKYKKEYGIVILVATPPFPYQGELKKYSSQGMTINFSEKMSPQEMEHIHFEDVSKTAQGKYVITGDSGFVLHVTHTGKTVEEARNNALDIVKKIVIPKMFYRNDIGMKFINEDEKKLRAWGWI